MSDLIDRQETIDFIEAGRFCDFNEPRWSDNEIVNFLKSRPSAQPKKGCWLDALDEDPCYYRCSECGRLSGFLENFCPECGADMRGEE